MEHNNYCGFALSDIDDYIKNTITADSKKFATALRSIMVKAQKFVLHNRDTMEAKIFDTKDVHIKLPYKIIALEYNISIPFGQIEPGTASKRIVLAFTDDAIPNDCKHMFTKCESDGWYIWPIAFFDLSKRWKINWVGAFLPLLNLRESYFHSEKYDIIPIFYGGQKESDIEKEIDDDLHEAMRNDLGGEIQTVVDFCCALNCSNVNVELAKAAKRHLLQKKSPKQYFEYHCLTIDTSKVAVESTREDTDDTYYGTHASPREHLRRGHVRRYKSGKTVWVNDTVVNAGVGGVIKKDYSVS